MKEIKIKKVEQLKAMCAEHEGVCECFILLNGNARSSKDIHHDPDKRTWQVFNYISDSWSKTYRSASAFKKGEPFLFEAMEQGALYSYR